MISKQRLDEIEADEFKHIHNAVAYKSSLSKALDELLAAAREGVQDKAQAEPQAQLTSAQECAEVMKDKARLDWLDHANGHVLLCFMGGAKFVDINLTGKETVRDAEIRTAIDAAMKRGEGAP